MSKVEKGNPIETITPIIPQPTFETWFDARQACLEMSSIGYAVIVKGGNAPYRVVSGEDYYAVRDLTGRLRWLYEAQDGAYFGDGDE